MYSSTGSVLAGVDRGIQPLFNVREKVLVKLVEAQFKTMECVTSLETGEWKEVFVKEISAHAVRKARICRSLSVICCARKSRREIFCFSRLGTTGYCTDTQGYLT